MYYKLRFGQVDALQKWLNLIQFMSLVNYVLILRSTQNILHATQLSGKIVIHSKHLQHLGKKLAVIWIWLKDPVLTRSTQA